MKADIYRKESRECVWNDGDRANWQEIPLWLHTKLPILACVSHGTLSCRSAKIIVLISSHLLAQGDHNSHWPVWKDMWNTIGVNDVLKKKKKGYNGILLWDKPSHIEEISLSNGRHYSENIGSCTIPKPNWSFHLDLGWGEYSIIYNYSWASSCCTLYFHQLLQMMAWSYVVLRYVVICDTFLLKLVIG